MFLINLYYVLFSILATTIYLTDNQSKIIQNCLYCDNLCEIVRFVAMDDVIV